MYKIYADNTLIYDSTIEDYKINKGSISLEINKSGSFTFSIYPDHFYYDKFVKLKTVITVYKSDKIVFRGRILNDDSDYQNNKNITCEGEYGFFQDSIIRPFDFTGTSEDMLKKFVNEHNSQMDAFKRFKVGKVTVSDPNDYIIRSNTAYESSFENINKRLVESELGGYAFITHGEDGTDEIPTINYLTDFETVATQKIEFGSNLKNYTKKATATEIGTAIIPLGATLNSETGERVTIKSVNNGVDYVYDKSAKDLRGWIFKTIEWDDVTDPANLKKKAEEYLETIINQNITIELTAIDLHLLDKAIESFKLGDYIQVISEPHNFNATMLCSKQTIDLLKPENDTVTLGYTFSSFTDKTGKVNSAIATISNMRVTVSKAMATVTKVNQTAEDIANNYNEVKSELGTVSGNNQILAEAITQNARNISTNATNISTNATNIESNRLAIEDIIARLEILEGGGVES